MKTSVALCTYNGEKFIHEQIDSILNQTIKVDEIVVSDDGSTDSTLQILEEYDRNNPGIFRIFKNEVNLRSVKNFEKAISLCENEIIFLCDQDDVWLPEKVEKYKDYFLKNMEINVLASNGFGIDEQNNLLSVYSIWDIPMFLRMSKSEVNYLEISAFCGNIITGATMAFRKKCIEKLIPFPEITGFHHDEWIGLNAAIKNKLHFFEEKFIKYRVHEEQQVGGIFLEKTDSNKVKLLKRYYFQEYSKSPKSKLSFLKLLKRREKIVNEVYLATKNKNFAKILKAISMKRTEIKNELKTNNYLFFLFNKVIGKI